MQKTINLSIALLLVFNLCQAQFLKRNLPENSYAETLAKIVESYPLNYRNIQGVSLFPDEDRDVYQSTINLPGASQSVIYRFHSAQDTTASWQAILYNGEDYKEALKVYKNAFRNIKQTKFKVANTYISFEGEMVAPTENLRFTSSLLRPSIPTIQYRNFLAEVEMIGSMEGWKVEINMHSRKDDDERY